MGLRIYAIYGTGFTASMIILSLAYMNMRKPNPSLLEDSFQKFKVETQCMDHPVEVVKKEESDHVIKISIRTIPPRMTTSKVDYWMEVVSDYENIQAYEISEFWISLYVSQDDDIDDVIDFATESYYNIFYNLA